MCNLPVGLVSPGLDPPVTSVLVSPAGELPSVASVASDGEVPLEGAVAGVAGDETSGLDPSVASVSVVAGELPPVTAVVDSPEGLDPIGAVVLACAGEVSSTVGVYGTSV